LPRRKNTVEVSEPPVIPDQMTEATEKKVPATSSKKGTPVTSSELLKLASQMAGKTWDQVARATGYCTEVTTAATGEVDVRVTRTDEHAFMQALMAAQGVNLAPPVRSSRYSNRDPIVTIGKNGNIVVGGRYTVIAGFPFGEGVTSKVRVEAEKGKITIFAADLEDSGLDAETDFDSVDEEDSELDD
jgi:hypothetical protein